MSSRLKHWKREGEGEMKQKILAVVVRSAMQSDANREFRSRRGMRGIEWRSFFLALIVFDNRLSLPRTGLKEKEK